MRRMKRLKREDHDDQRIERQDQQQMTTMQPNHHSSRAPRAARTARPRLKPLHRRLSQALGPTLSTLTLTLGLGLSTLPAPAAAGFLEDYYTAAGAQTAVTEPAVLQSQSVNLVTGGSFMLKTPRKSFTPYSLEAPHLKAGCGGIDLFLGSFSMPSKEEFVSFLRSVGTALPGVAYQLALQSMSPDLNEIVAEYRDMLMSVTDGLTDSCTAAETLLNKTGAAEHLQAAGHWARSQLRTSGAASDASDAESLTRTDGAKVVSSVPERMDSGGNVIQAAELNLTWSLLKGGKLASADTEHLEVMMTMLGTTVYRKTGSGDNTTILSEDYAPEDLVHSLYSPGDQTTGSVAAGSGSSIGDNGGGSTRSTAGRADTTTQKKEFRVLVCDEPVKCLNPKWTTRTDVNLVAAVTAAANRYKESLIQGNRDHVTKSDILMLANISSIPLLGIIEATASPRMPGLSDAYVRIYSEAAAYELIMNALSELSTSAEAVIKASSGKAANALLLAHAERLLDRVHLMETAMQAQKSNLALALQNAQQLAATVDFIRRSVYGQAAAEIAAQLPGAAREGGF